MNNLIRIPFHHQTIVAMRPVVENLGLSWKTQYRKITEKFGKGVVILTTPSAGGLQDMTCLPLSKFPGFLYSINANKVAPELHTLVIAYQDECTEILYNHFIGKHQHEHHALLTAIFAKHPLWQDTQALALQGLSHRQIGERQGRHHSSVGKMLQRIAKAGLMTAIRGA